MIKFVVALFCQNDFSVSIELNARVLIVSYLFGNHRSDSDCNFDSGFGVLSVFSFLRLNIHAYYQLLKMLLLLRLIINSYSAFANIGLHKEYNTFTVLSI